MKKLLCAFALLFGLSAFAQTGFIEVEVRDTILMKPVSFTYEVRVNTWSIYPPLSAGVVDTTGYDVNADAGYDAEKLKAETEKNLKSVEKLLLKNGFKPKPLNVNNLQDADYDYYGKGFSVAMKSADEVAKLQKALKGLDYVTTQIGSADFGDTSGYEKKLLEKLIGNARKKAAVIAQFSGLSLGKILEVKEVREIDNFSYSLMNTILGGKRGWDSQLSGENRLENEFTKALVIKFEAK